MHRERLLIFPFDKTGLPVIKQVAGMDWYSIEKVVAPKSVALSGLDVAQVQNRSDFGYSIENSFEDALGACDTVLVLNHEDRFKKYVNRNLEIAVKENKKIILLSEPDDVLKRIISGSNFEVIEKDISERYASDEIVGISTKIETPILFIGSIYPINSTHEIAVDLTTTFREAGYKAVTACTDKNLMLGKEYFTIPNFMFSDDLGNVERIEKAKKWVKGLETAEAPDVIMITVPDAMMILDENSHFGYCINPFLLSSAITPDYFVFDSVYGKNQEFYSMISNHFLHRYGYSVDYVVATNLVVDYMMSKEARKLHYNYRSAKKILEEIKQKTHDKIKETTILSNSYAESIVADIISKLSSEVPFP